MSEHSLEPVLTRIADALDRLAPRPVVQHGLKGADAFVWHSDPERLEAVLDVSRIDLNLLQGIEQQTKTLYDNTKRFAKGLPANNALLWGARGTGKSSLIKAVHARCNEEDDADLAIIEVSKNDGCCFALRLVLLVYDNT